MEHIHNHAGHRPKTGITSFFQNINEVKNGFTSIVYALLLNTYFFYRQRMVFVFYAIFNHNWFYKFIKKHRLVKSVFIINPEKKWYAKAYVHPSRWPQMRWKPWLIGLYKVKNGWGLMFVISTTSQEVADKKNTGNIVRLLREVEILKEKTGAKYSLFTGSIPGILKRKKLRSAAPETGATVDIIKKSVQQVVSQSPTPDQVPIIILGANGHIGKNLTNLQTCFHNVIEVDKNSDLSNWTQRSTQCPHIVLNVSTPKALKNYLHLLTEKTKIINEVYPPPNKGFLSMLKGKGVEVYHIKGVCGWAFPVGFPGHYNGAVPACGTWQAGERPKIKKLN